MTSEAPPALTELQAWPRWVCWRTVMRKDKDKDKPTKVPYQPRHPRRKASSTDPDTWGTHQQAVAAKGVDGIGYVFAIDDEYAGVDLDHCVDEHGNIHADAMRIVRALDSYTEYSPTGTGLHIIVRAAVNGDGNRTTKTGWGGDFENYDRARFFTFTGRHLFGTPDIIQSRQAELDKVRAELFPPVAPAPAVAAAPVAMPLSDADIIEKIRKSKQARTFDPLWNGDTAGHGEDDSAADLALCNILAFWFATPDRIDGVFRQSGLMREKWDDPRPGGTYGTQTIGKALEGRTEFYAPGRKHERPADDDVKQDDGEALAQKLALVGDPFVEGIKTGNTTRDRYILTARSGATLDLDPIGAYTGSHARLSNEVALQLGVNPYLKGEVGNILVLLRRFCRLQQAETLDDRAFDLGCTYLQVAPTHPVESDTETTRWPAFHVLEERGDPGTRARAEAISLAAAGLVLVDGNGARYVRVQWFTDFAKASALPGTAADIVRRMEFLGWVRPTNVRGRIKARQPGGAGELAWAFFIVPEGWERD